MNQNHRGKCEVPFGPCPPDEFSGRFEEKIKLLEVCQRAKEYGTVVMVSGRRGSGKSSLLNWAEHLIQNEKSGPRCPVVKKDFFETDGMVFATYRELIKSLTAHQKFTWFRKIANEPRVRKSIDLSLSALEKMSPLVGPYSKGVEIGVDLVRGLLPTESADYTQLFSSLAELFSALSEQLTNENRFLVIILDDVQWSSGPDFQLMKDLIRNLPPGILMIIAFRLETETEEKYVKLLSEIYRYGHVEIRLSGMNKDEIKELASRRYRLFIDDPIADFLSSSIGDPLCLVSCFNLLQKRKFSPNLDNFQKIMPQALDSAKCVYTSLDMKWQNRVNSLCILHPPLQLSVISCMLRELDIIRLKDELDQSLIFKRLEVELYDFAHPSLREYRKNELPKSTLKELHFQAAKCLENLEARL